MTIHPRGDSMERRSLMFADLEGVRADLHNLRQLGYSKVGTWDLAQTCDHLGYFIEGSLDGWHFKVPWLLKVLFGRIALNQILRKNYVKVGIPTPQKPLPSPGGDEAAAVSRLEGLLERLRTRQGEFHDSPFFGHLTPDQWQQLHRIHCAHHLSFLIPNGEKEPMGTS